MRTWGFLQYKFFIITIIVYQLIKWQIFSSPIRLFLILCSYFILATCSIVTRNGQSENSDQMGRSTRLCWQPSYTKTHSSLPWIKIQIKQKSREVKTVCPSPVYLFIWLNICFFLSFIKIQTCQNQTVLKRFQFVKETQLSTDQSRMEGQTSTLFLTLFDYFLKNYLGKDIQII